ncbi:MAG: ATP-binding protein [bacterium]
MERTLTGSTSAILDLAREVASLGEKLGFTRKRGWEIETAVVEALSNAARHGNGGREQDPIRLNAQPAGARLLVEVHDRGAGLSGIPPLPDLEKKLRGEEPPGGWGVFLIRSLASDVQFVVHPGGGHTLRLRFDSEAPAQPVEPRITETPNG